MNDPEQHSQVKFDIKKVYLKDASFESPNAPHVFTQDEIAPAIDVQMAINNAELGGEKGYYEVALTVTVTAKVNDQPIFLAEVVQAGVFEISGIAKSQLPLALEIGGPNVLLPFAREAVADLVAKGGFPQLLINPINFEALYEHKRNQIKKRKAQREMTKKNGNGSNKPQEGPH